MRTQIFFYKGYIGAITDMDNGTFLNSPKTPGETGVTVAVTEVDITKEAVEALKNAGRYKSVEAPIMLNKGSDKIPANIYLHGFAYHGYNIGERLIGKDCDTSILDLCNVVEIELDPDFKEFVEQDILETAKEE